MHYRPTLEQYELIFDNTFDSIFLIGVEGKDRYRILSVNKRLLTVTGRSPEDLVGKTIDEVYEGRYRDYLIEKYGKAIAAGEPFRYETHTAGESVEVYIDTTMVPIFDDAGQPTHLIGVSRDITRQRLERRALEREKQRAENYLNIAEAIIVALDPGCNVTMMNRKGYLILGYPEGSLTGRNWCDVCVPASNRQRFMEGFKGAFEVGHVGANVNEIVTADGDIRLVSWANTMVLNEDGKPTGVLSSGEDITDRRRAEKSLIASQRLLAAEEVIAAVAHDFNNSLQGVLGNIDLALTKPGLDDDARRHLETAARLTEDAASRIRKLQQATEIEPSETYKAVAIDELINEVIAQAEPLWGEGARQRGVSIAIEREFAPESSAVRGNRSELRTVFYNVVKNAIEAMESDGTVRFETAVDDDMNVVLVKDTGVGMDFDTSARVFQPFYSTKGLEAGRGLGMSSAHGIVRAHGGDMLIRDTAIGRGTTIEIRLPTSELMGGFPKAAVPDDKPGHCVLWVDDDAAVRQFAENFFAGSGIRGEVATSAAEALQMMDFGDFTLVITDIGMAGMDGMELARRLRQDNPDLPVVALTGWGDRRKRSAADSPVFDEILAKPVSLRQLREVLQRYPAVSS